MALPEECILMRVYIGKADKYKGKTLYKQIVAKAKELELAGAMVLHGSMGFGFYNKFQNAKLVKLHNRGLPVVVEIVDTAEKIQRIMPFLGMALQGGLVTVEKIRVVQEWPIEV